MVIAGNYPAQYTFSIWYFEGEKLDMLLENNEDTLANCLGVHVFEKTSSFAFAIVEKRCIKYWKLDGKKLLLVNRVHVKEDIMDTQLNPDKNFLLFLNEHGRVYIINKEVKTI